jgi:hypothetical protein
MGAFTLLPIGCLSARPSDATYNGHPKLVWKISSLQSQIAMPLKDYPCITIASSDTMAGRHRIGLMGGFPLLPIGCLRARPSGGTFNGLPNLFGRYLICNHRLQYN